MVKYSVTKEELIDLLVDYDNAREDDKCPFLYWKDLVDDLLEKFLKDKNIT